MDKTGTTNLLTKLNPYLYLIYKNFINLIEF